MPEFYIFYASLCISLMDRVVGWCPTQATVRGGVRWSSYRAFLRRARHRDNLHIITYATVTKVTSQLHIRIYLCSSLFLPS